MTNKIIVCVGVTATFVTLAAGCSQAPKESDSLQRKDVTLAPIKVVINNLDRKFPDGTNESDNPYMDYIKENVGFNIKVVAPPSAGYEENLNVIMASGDAPDMISTTNMNWVVGLGRQHRIKPLNGVIDKYGPDLKRLIPQYAWDQVTIDGSIYAIPRVSPYSGQEIVYVRKDWLDKVGMPPPKTLDEFTQVMKAFAEKDPDGDGKANTYGTIMESNFLNSDAFFGAFGTVRGQWFIRDNKLVYTSILPETKEALRYLAQLYKDKLLDPEWLLNKPGNFQDKVASGRVGLYSGDWADTKGPINRSKLNDPKAQWIDLPYPVGPTGKSGTRGIDRVAGFNVIPASSQNEEQVIKFLNFIIGKGQKVLKLGFENQVYKTLAGGKIETNFDEHNKQLYRNSLAELVEPDDLSVVHLRLDSLGEQFNLNHNLDQIAKSIIPNKYFGPPTETMVRSFTVLQNMENEAFAKIIMGLAPIDDFDKFVADWKQGGGAKMTSEVNEWFQNSSKK